jgi:hypothetical protein
METSEEGLAKFEVGKEACADPMTIAYTGMARTSFACWGV